MEDIVAEESCGGFECYGAGVFPLLKGLLAGESGIFDSAEGVVVEEVERVVVERSFQAERGVRKVESELFVDESVPMCGVLVEEACAVVGVPSGVANPVAAVVGESVDDVGGVRVETGVFGGEYAIAELG